MSAISPYNPTTNNLFIPGQVSTCSVWLDGQDRNSMVFSGTNVTTWKDKSGNGNDSTATGNISNIQSINGKYAMAYPGTNSTYFRGNLVNTTSGSVTGFAVVNVLATSFAAIRTVSLGVSGTADYNNSLYVALIEKGGSGLNSFRNSGAKATATYTAGTPGLVCSIYDGTSNYFYVNGTAGTPVASTGNFGYSNYEIGSEFGEESLVHYDGYIGEIILFNKISLNTQQRQQVEGYLAWKWGLQTSLPTTHPYYNNAYIPNSYIIPYFPPRLTPTNVVPSVSGFTIPTTVNQYIYSAKDLPNIALWLDAADKNTIVTSGSNVIQWNDKSGKTTTTVVSQPTLSGTYINGYQTLRFNSNRITAPLTGTIGTGDYSLFSVWLTINGGTEVVLSIGSNGNNAALGYNGTYYNLFEWGQTESDFTAAKNIYAVQSGTRTSSTKSLFINGSNAPTASGALNLLDSTVYIGGSGFPINGEICEVLIFSNTISVSQRQQVEGYLAWKWNLQKSLPSNHPFYLFPPG